MTEPTHPDDRFRSLLSRIARVPKAEADRAEEKIRTAPQQDATTAPRSG